MIDGPRPVRLQNSGDIYYELGPDWSNQEREISEALLTATIPGDEIVASWQAPWFVTMWPPRYGYPDYPERQAGITLVLDVDRAYGNRRMDLSGGVVGAQASARNVGVADVW